jgi:hypothetical protein
MTDSFDHDHRAEDAFLDYVASPTPENAHSAELAIALLQRGYDAVVRRLDGDAVPPLASARTHNAWDLPEACVEGSLRALVHDVDEARRYARLLYQQVTFGVLDYGALGVPMDEDEWPAWLTYYDRDDPARQGPAKG